ncbi:hypothetical protein SAMN04488096_105183 [Mesonia phycicola]|uniref:Uncharacterized protein n=1 Tax=Mesonia phycicola TaxID=579105 RepID=A0A1M6ENY0_9FLAO|nr:hypothetical protein SAMN04488096_105183 [Mesonia phycicola]
MVACEDQPTNTADSESTFQEENAKKFSQKVNIPSNRTVSLLPDAEAASSNWMAFITAKNEIERIDHFTLQEVVNNSNNFFRSVKQLQDSIPTDFEKTPIKTRLNVLLTKAYLLETEAERQRPNAGKIDTLSFELYNEFNNLKIQLNEAFLKPMEDFDLELDERIRIQDSLAKAKKEPLKKIK